MLIGAYPFIDAIRGYRLCWISGRFSGGKTSLAIRLAQEFLEDGYRLVTNIRTAWADPLETINLDQDDGDHLKAVVLLDEGGLHIKYNDQLQNMASFAAKMDCVYIWPSFWPPIRQAQVVVAQPMFNFSGIGIPLIYYKWYVQLGGFKDNGSFMWWCPQEVYGVYSRQDPGDHPEDIFDFLIARTEDFEAFHNRKRRADGLPEVEAGPSEAQLFRDAVGDLAELSSGWTAIPERKNTRRRR